MGFWLCYCLVMLFGAAVVVVCMWFSDPSSFEGPLDALGTWIGCLIIGSVGTLIGLGLGFLVGILVVYSKVPPVSLLVVSTMYIVGILLIWGFSVLYKGTLHSIFLTWGLDEAYRTATGKNSDSDAYKRVLKILGGGAALVAIYWSRLPGLDALVARMTAGMNSGCIAITARMIASPVSEPNKYQQALNDPGTFFWAGVIQYGIGLMMLWGLWSFYSGSLHSILLTWFLHETYSKVTSQESESSRYDNAILVLETLTVLVAIYWSRLPGIDSAVGGVMSAYMSALTSLFGG